MNELDIQKINETIKKYPNIQEIYSFVMEKKIDNGMGRIKATEEEYIRTLSGDYENRKKLRTRISAGKQVVEKWRKYLKRKIDLEGIDIDDVGSINRIGINEFINVYHENL